MPATQQDSRCSNKGANLLEIEENCLRVEALDVGSWIMQHLQMNKAPERPCHTHRAQSRTSLHLSVPCPVAVRLSLREQTVPTSEEEAALKGKMFQEKLLRQNLKRGKKCKEKNK